MGDNGPHSRHLALIAWAFVAKMELNLDTTKCLEDHGVSRIRFLRTPPSPGRIWQDGVTRLSSRKSRKRGRPRKGESRPEKKKTRLKFFNDIIHPPKIVTGDASGTAKAGPSIGRDSISIFGWSIERSSFRLY
jgi:hypothetical protein